MLYTGSTGRVLTVSNLDARKCEIDLAPELPDDVDFVEMFANRRYRDDEPDPGAFTLDGHGYRWLRLVS